MSALNKNSTVGLVRPKADVNFNCRPHFWAPRPVMVVMETFIPVNLSRCPNNIQQLSNNNLSSMQVESDSDINPNAKFALWRVHGFYVCSRYLYIYDHCNLIMYRKHWSVEVRPTIV